MSSSHRSRLFSFPTAQDPFLCTQLNRLRENTPKPTPKQTETKSIRAGNQQAGIPELHGPLKIPRSHPLKQVSYSRLPRKESSWVWISPEIPPPLWAACPGLSPSSSPSGVSDSLQNAKEKVTQVLYLPGAEQHMWELQHFSEQLQNTPNELQPRAAQNPMWLHKLGQELKGIISSRKCRGTFWRLGLEFDQNILTFPLNTQIETFAKQGSFGKHLLILALPAMRLAKWPRITRNLRCWELSEQLCYTHVQLLSGFWKRSLDRIPTAVHIGWKRSAHTSSLDWKFCHPYLERKNWNT